MKKRVCPFCRSGFGQDDEAIRCSRCKSSHHRVCWALFGRCSIYGCSGKPLSSGFHLSVIPAFLLFLSQWEGMHGHLLMFLFVPSLLYCISALVLSIRRLDEFPRGASGRGHELFRSISYFAAMISVVL